MEWFYLLLWTIILALLFRSFLKKPKNLPPGPWGLPIVGYFPFLGKYPYKTLARLGRKYGSVYTLPLGHKYAVVLNDWKGIQEALIQQAETFSGRPSTVLIEDVVQRADVSTSHGAEWKERRRFTLHHLRDFGFGRHSMEEIIVSEIEKLVQRFRSAENQKVDICDTFFFSFMNIIWNIVGGKNFDSGNKYMAEFAKIIRVIFRELDTMKMIHFMPYLKHIPGMSFQGYLDAEHRLRAFLKKEIEEHIRTYQDSNHRDFVDVYLSEIYKREKLPEKSTSFQKENLVGVLHNLFNAAIDTGSNSISWGLLYMASWPNIQEKVQKELDEVVGRSRLPSFSDRQLLPYTEAVILEIQRYASIVPLSLPHSTLSLTTLMGYTIPKGTFIFENIWAVHHNPEYWGDPEVFRPERFLNDQGQVQKPEYFIPFSVGSRMCLGEPLARMELFLFFSCLMHQCSFSWVTGEQPPSFDPAVSITLSPQKFSLIVKPR